MTRVVGVDAVRRLGWVGVVVDRKGFVESHLAERLVDLIAAVGRVEVVAVDIPIGNVSDGGRRADAEARALVGPRSSTVFNAPPIEVLDAGSYEEARDRCAAMGGPSISAQAWALVPRINEAHEVAVEDDRVHEVHPEVCFAAMAGGPLGTSKHSWAGVRRRWRLLREQGIVVPDELGDAGHAGADDVLDAAAAAWSARRIAGGEHRCLPDPPQAGIGGRDVAIYC